MPRILKHVRGNIFFKQISCAKLFLTFCNGQLLMLQFNSKTIL